MSTETYSSELALKAATAEADTLLALSQQERAQRIARAVEMAERYGCLYCARVYVSGGPSHEGSPRCRSGRRSHCACDTCF